MCSSQMDTQPKLLTKLSTIEPKKERMEAAQKEENNENDKYLLYCTHLTFSEKIQKGLRKERY